MPFINLLPTTLKKAKSALEKKIAPPPSSRAPGVKIFALWPVFIVAALFLAIMVLQLAQLAVSQKTVSSLEKKIGALKSGYQKIDGMTKKKVSLAETLSFLEKASAKETLWSEKFYLISKLLPPQIWLTSISVESKQARTTSPGRAEQKKDGLLQMGMERKLTIKGNATSLIEADIIGSITQFVDALKKEPSFNKDFDDIKLGPLQSDKKGNLIIMKFIIYCRDG